MVIAVVASLMSAGTISYFSDEEKAEGTFTAGTIDIELDPDTAQTVMVDGRPDLKPCEVGWINLTVKNVGTNPLELWKHIENVTNWENDINDPEGEYYEMNPESEFFNLSDYVHYDIYINDTEYISESEGFVLTDNMSTSWIGVECKWIYIGVLQPGEWIWINQSYHINYTVDNWAQTDMITFDMVFLALQVEGAIPPEPAPVLPGYGRP